MSNTNHFVYILEDGKDIAYNEIHYVYDVNDDNDHSIMSVKLVSEIYQSATAYICEIPSNLMGEFNIEDGNYFIDALEQNLLNYIRSNGKPIF